MHQFAGPLNSGGATQKTATHTAPSANAHSKFSVFQLHPASNQRSVDGALNKLWLRGLLDEVKSPRPDRRNSHPNVTIARDHDERHIWCAFSSRFKGLESVPAGHSHVTKNDTRPFRVERCQHRVCVCKLLHFSSSVHQKFVCRLAKILIVIDNHHVRFS